MAKFIFHLNSPWRILKKILISCIPFLTLTACSGGPFVTEFGTSFSGEGSGSPGSGPSPAQPPSGPLPCGPEGPIDPAAAGFLCDIIASAGTLSPSFDPDDITYTLTLPFLTPSTYTITLTSGDLSFTLTLNGDPVNSDAPVDLTAPDPGGSSILVIRVRDTNGNETVYTITVERQSANNFAQQVYLKASNTGDGDLFSKVAISGDTLVVGAEREDSNATGVNGDQFNDSADGSGAAYVFVRSGTTWTQQAYLKASNTGGGDNFGTRVAISGDTIVVGAGFEDSDATGVNGDQFNNSAPGSGAAYVFVRSGTTWTQQAYLKASNTGLSDQFGQGVGISGDTIVVGSWREDSNATGVNGDQFNDSLENSGVAYVFVRSGTTWTQQAYLKASNTEEFDLFGQAVAISGNTIVVGANLEDSNATGVNGDDSNNDALNSGAAYVFVRSGTIWTQQAYLKASNTDAADSFGGTAAISGDTIAVGARGERSNATGVNGDESNNDLSKAGAAYVFVRSGSTWSQQAYLKASNTQAQYIFGKVAISGDTVVVRSFVEDSDATGVNGDDSNTFANNSGAAYVFVRSGTTWSQQAYLKASNTEELDNFGSDIAISGDTIAVGARNEDSNATGFNGNEFNNSALGSGAVYVFK